MEFGLQLFTGDFELRIKFGVPKHSELEPDYFVAEGNGNASS
jgi:hypothetical protein